MCDICIYALISLLHNKYNHYIVALSISIGYQLTNNVLYMIKYFHKVKDSDNKNYSNTIFAT